MPTDAEITAKFWKSLRSDMTLMLGLVGLDEGHTQPMTAQFTDDSDTGPIWFFTANDTHLAQALGGESHAAEGQFVAKGHDLFASIQGELAVVDDPVTIDRLWNRFVAAWFPGGKTDPKLQLLRFDPERAQVWLNEHSLVAGVKILLGKDPKAQYRDKVADVDLRHA